MVVNDLKRKPFSSASKGLRWLILGLSALVAVMLFQSYSPEESAGSSAPAGAAIKASDLPPEARHVLVLVKRGGPFPHEQDGTVFGNREGLLPRQTHGYYSEYTVPTPGLSHRGARRIVAGQGRTGSPTTSGEYWYTADHYASFRRIQE